MFMNPLYASTWIVYTNFSATLTQRFQARCNSDWTAIDPVTQDLHSNFPCSELSQALSPCSVCYNAELSTWHTTRNGGLSDVLTLQTGLHVASSGDEDQGEFGSLLHRCTL